MPKRLTWIGFDRGVTDRTEFHLRRQVLCSVNFSTGGDLRDFLHCALSGSTRLEHHPPPSTSRRARTERVQPRAKRRARAPRRPPDAADGAPRHAASVSFVDVTVGQGHDAPRRDAV